MGRCGWPGLEATSRTFRRAYRPPKGFKRVLKRHDPEFYDMGLTVGAGH